MAISRLAFPLAAELEAEEIVELRAKLVDHLLPFRDQMLTISLDLAQGISSQTNMHEVLQGIDLRVKKVELTLSDLSARVRFEKGKLFSKLISGVGGFISIGSIITSLATKSWWISLVGTGAQIAKTYADHRTLLDQMERESKLAYLIELHRRILTDEASTDSRW